MQKKSNDFVNHKHTNKRPPIGGRLSVVMFSLVATFLGNCLRLAGLTARDALRLAAATPTSVGFDNALFDRPITPFDVNPRRCNFDTRNVNNHAVLRAC